MRCFLSVRYGVVCVVLQSFAEGAKSKVEKLSVGIREAVNKKKHLPAFGRSLEDFTEAELL